MTAHAPMIDEKVKGDYASVSVLSNILQNVLCKRIVR